MIALITGASGQLGRALLACAPQGWQIFAPDREALDLANPRSIRSAVQGVAPDFVINAGAFTSVDLAETEKELASAINAGAPQVFAETLREIGSGRLFQISTDFVFDGTRSNPYNPEDTRNPLSVYGQTKAKGEDAAGPDSIILRTSWVYSSAGSNFVRTMLRMMREGKKMQIVSDQIGAPSYAPDIAKVIWALANEDRPGIFHHSDSGQASWYGFAKAIGETALELGLVDGVPEIEPIPASEYPTPARRPAYSVLDCSGTRALLGDQAKPWRENLTLMLKEERARG